MKDIKPAVLRRHILTMAYHGGSVHIACAFSLVEVFATLYSKLLRFDSKDPAHPDRDYLILSKGHGVMALYACYRELGWLPENALREYFQDASQLAGLCESRIPGFEVCSGSLGHGLPIATGIAFGLKRRKKDQRVYCIVGDGEMNEGPIWESLLFAAHHKLDNFIVIVDANRFQAMGTTESIIGLESLTAKFESFGFEAVECDGHVPDAIHKSVSDLLARKSSRPLALVARTVKGKGVSFMEDRNEWHYTRLDSKLFEQAITELKGELDA